MKKLALTVALGIAATVPAISVVRAHHSTSAYDTSKTLDLQGTVVAFQWTNPHSWIQLAVPDANGKTIEWSIEFGAPNLNARNGWKRDDVKPGDKVSLVIYPIRDGSAHGTLATIQLADGRVLKGAADFIREQFAPPPAPSPAAPER